MADESSGLGGKEGGCKAYGVAGESSGVGGKEGGRNAYGVAEIPREDRQVVREGVESLQGINTPGVDELPRGEETTGVSTKG